MRLFIGKSGQIKRNPPGTAATVSTSLPTGVSVVSPFVRPDAQLFQGLDRMPMVGSWNHNLMWLSRNNQLVILGIEAGDNSPAPTLAAGSGTGITGSAIGVYTFAQMINGVVIHESNPSTISNTVALVNKDRSWTDLPTTHPNPRVTHKRLYVSMDGGDFQYATTVLLSAATATENVATAALADVDPLLFRRGVPPYAKFVANYAGRCWYSDGSDVFYFSEIDEPESVPATNSLRTKDARFIKVFRATSDQLFIATRKSCQDVQGYSADDFEMRYISQHIGGISHHASIILNDKLWLLSQDGYHRYGGGGFQYLMPTLRTYFTKAYLADAATYEDSVAALDLYSHVLKLLIPGSSAFYYIGHFLPSEVEFGGSGNLPYWTFDKRDREDSVVGVLTSNSLRDEAYTGSCDGYIRRDNVEDDPDDDGDTFQKQMSFATAHMFMGDQSGDDAHARTFQRLTMFVKAEETPWTPEGYAGDDDAFSALVARWTPERLVPASRLTKSGRTAVAKTSHHFKLDNCAGKGLTVGLIATAPVRVEYRGLALEFENTGQNTMRDEAGE